MDSPMSWFYLQGMRSMIAAAPTDAAQEARLRDLLAGMVGDCPMDVLVRTATALADGREDELRRPTNN